MDPNFCWTKLSCTVDFDIFCDLFPQIDPLFYIAYIHYTPVLKRHSYQQSSNEPLHYHEKVHLQGTNVNKAGLHLK